MKDAKIIENEIRTKSKIKGFIIPDYEKYCISNIPNTVLSIFGIETGRKKLPLKLLKENKNIKKIIILLIDSLGYDVFLKSLKRDKNTTLSKITKKGIFIPLTSVFPSTTPVAIPTFTTGLSPEQHGLIASSFFYERVKKIISVLFFMLSDLEKNLKYLGIKHKDLLNSETIFETLNKNKIKSFSITDEEFLGTDFNNLVYRGSKKLSYKSYNDCFKKIKEIIETNKKVFVFSYFWQIDYLLHGLGINSKIILEELKIFDSELKKFIKGLDKKTLKETLLIISSDHGQINLSKKKMIFLKKDQTLLKNLDCRPMGGIRGVFFKAKKGKEEKIKKYLKNRYKDKALILETTEAIKMGLFGSKKTTRIHKRMGDILLIPYDNYTFLSPYKEGQKNLLAQHGGLSEEEMLVPFLCVKLSELVA